MFTTRIRGVLRHKATPNAVIRVSARQKSDKEQDGCTKEKECGPCAKTIYMDPKCKTALITGGATGIGLAMADQLLCAGAYRVVLGGLDPDEGAKAIEILNGIHGRFKACFMLLDVNCEKQFEDMFKEMQAKFGSVDILCNNAGILYDKKWRKEISTNFEGVTLGILLAMKYMKRQKDGGVVVNTASFAGIDPLPYAPINSGTKFGVVGLSRGFGDKYYFDTWKVRVVGLCPGITDTDYIKGAGSRQLDKEIGAKLMSCLLSAKMQPTKAVGQALVHLVKYGDPGSCWLIEDSRLFALKFPDRFEISTMMNAF